VSLPEAVTAYLTVEAVGEQGDATAIRAPARLAFRDSAMSRVGAPIPARVMKLHVKVGDRVKVGDKLATLASPDASGYHAELARAKVELTAVTASLRRQEEMLAKGVGREYEKIAAEMQVRDAKERVKAAKRDVGLLGTSFGGTVIVTSQIDGTVLRRNATVGAQVEPGGDPLFEIGNPKDLWVVADVFQDDLDLIVQGAAVKVTLAGDQSSVEGTIASIGVLLDTAVRRAPVYIELSPREADGLKAGMFARAEISSEHSDGIVLPTAAVLLEGGAHTIVYVERADGSFERREVEIGHSFGDRVEVVAGLERGERVVTKGALLINGAAGQLL
jgi:cobalt-zinc-cadmium efflux system membrane fusion protein